MLKVERAMLKVTLIVCVVSVTWATFAPAVMPRVTPLVAPLHKMNFSMAARDILFADFRNYTLHAPKPNSTWTMEDWKESLGRCQKATKETRKGIISKIPQNDVAGVENYLDVNEAAANPNFRAFLTRCRVWAEQFDLSQKDSIIEIFQETLQPGCLKEMPPTILKESWKKCREAVMNAAPSEEKGKTDIFLRKIAVHELPSLTWRDKPLRLRSSKSTLYTDLCLADARKAGLSPQDFEAVKDMIDEYLIADESVDKTGFTPKEWVDYQRSREVKFFQLMEKAAENNPAHADQVRAAFELIRVRHERLKIRDKMLFLRRVTATAKSTHLTENTTQLLIRELKKFLIITHTHIGFGDEDERRADQELTMSYGVIKMRLLDRIPKEEQENLAHFFFSLSRDLPDTPQHLIRLPLRNEEDREPFENYTTSVARKCQMWNDSLYTFWETHNIYTPGPKVVKQYNQKDYFIRKAILILKWSVVKNLTMLGADELQAGNLNCFFQAIEKDFVEARRNALYRHIQTDEMNFVGNFRRNIRANAKRANISSENVDSMLQIVSALRPNVTLPESEDPTLGQLLVALVACGSFTTNFKEQCYATIKDHEGLDKFFQSLEAPLKRERLTPQNLEDNGFICETPEGSEHKIRDTSNPDQRVFVVHSRQVNFSHLPSANIHPHQEIANNVPVPPPHKVHHHHNPLHSPLLGKHKHEHKHETTTEAEITNSTFE